MKLNFTSQQFDTLAPYRKYFELAVRERWTRNPGRAALTQMAEIWRDVAHLPGFRMDYNCSTCIVNLLTDLGTLFFQDEQVKAKKDSSPANVDSSAENVGSSAPKVETAETEKPVAKAKTVKTGTKKGGKK